ncbi:motile sperm domain-containing protein 2 [Diabrotica virgifera virgifera]|uniref:Motile sperm domain-containing protein 2-like n=1 Tax=Diabrotica virgifera virgifera TaxID=50390 RepID=A0ABM5KT63_DIAVI|nr:motile sperm domain-containing protein 2 [Diabrotica virgifera virgifera]
MVREYIEVSKPEIEDLRKSFLDEVSSKGNDSIHPKDLQRVKTDDDWLRRFYLHQEKNQEKAREMMWSSISWRKEQNVNEINEDTVNKEILCSGAFSIHGEDVDGCKLLVFKCNKHTKGAIDVNIVKQCIIYWFERLERTTKGDFCSIFFDMEGCGLSNMDMDVIKYLIGLFNSYYPYFLNYILIFEMPWVLTAAFKIVKTLLPEKAKEKIKFISKKDISTFVPTEHIITSWGGKNPYVFSFVPETFPDQEKEKVVVSNNNKKVHFVDGSMSEQAAAATTAEKESDGGYLKVTPPGIITFVKDGNELISTLELQNADDSIHVSYKLKTTSPEKFRVKPSTGCLAPGETVVVNVTLFPGFQLGGLSRDKFLVMSTPMETSELDNLDLPELWKNTSGRKLYQHRLKCIQSGEVTKNGNVTVTTPTAAETDQSSISQLSSTISEIRTAQIELRQSVKITQYFQMVTLFLVLILGVVVGYMARNSKDTSSEHPYCNHP